MNGKHSQDTWGAVHLNSERSQPAHVTSMRDGKVHELHTLKGRHKSKLRLTVSEKPEELLLQQDPS